MAYFYRGGVIWRMCQATTVVRILDVCFLAQCWLSVLWRMCCLSLITENPFPMIGLGVCTAVRNMEYVIHHITDF